MIICFILITKQPISYVDNVRRIYTADEGVKGKENLHGWWRGERADRLSLNLKRKSPDSPITFLLTVIFTRVARDKISFAFWNRETWLVSELKDIQPTNDRMEIKLKGLMATTGNGENIDRD